MFGLTAFALPIFVNGVRLNGVGDGEIVNGVRVKYFKKQKAGPFGTAALQGYQVWR